VLSIGHKHFSIGRKNETVDLLHPRGRERLVLLLCAREKDRRAENCIKDDW
jgi:hypothetical protein